MDGYSIRLFKQYRPYCDICPSVFIAVFVRLRSLSSPQKKLKKIKEKYKDQDEEDRELMMQLLGVRTNQENSPPHGHRSVLSSDTAANAFLP